MKTILLLFLVSCLPCYAHIGETIDQSIKRYGTAYDIKEPAPLCKDMSFMTGAFYVKASFYKGVCVGLNISKSDISGLRELSDAEIKAILDQNSDGATWGEFERIPDSSGEIWETQCKRSDGTFAYWVPLDKKVQPYSINILGPDIDDYDAAYKAAQLNAAKKETNGL